jgi:hypothetical protein
MRDLPYLYYVRVRLEVVFGWLHYFVCLFLGLLHLRKIGLRNVSDLQEEVH